MKYILHIFVSLLILSGCASKSNKTETNTSSNGTIERIENFPSKYVNARNIDIWLPNDYSEDENYSVLYMHDGQMLFDSIKSWNKQEWCVDETMSRLLKEGKIRNTIVVGIWNTEFRHSEYFPQKPFEALPQNFKDSLLTEGKRHGESTLFEIEVCSDKYLKFIVEELKPYIDQHYSTLPDAKNTFIAGSSMGGLISMYALCEYPEVFSGAACLSTHWVGTFDTLNNPIPSHFANYLDEHLPNPRKHAIYFDFGTETLDALYEPYQTQIDSVMIQHGFTAKNWKTRKFEGQDHSERAWAKRLEIPLTFLLKK